MNFKVGDLVLIITGKNRFFLDKDGKKNIKIGKILKLFPKKQKAIVEGVNIVHKHQRPAKDEKKGNIIKTEAPIHISNISLVDPATKIRSKVGFRIENNKKIRYLKKTGVSI